MLATTSQYVTAHFFSMNTVEWAWAPARWLTQTKITRSNNLIYTIENQLEDPNCKSNHVPLWRQMQIVHILLQNNQRRQSRNILISFNAMMGSSLNPKNAIVANKLWFAISLTHWENFISETNWFRWQCKDTRLSSNYTTTFFYVRQANRQEVIPEH